METTDPVHRLRCALLDTLMPRDHWTVNSAYLDLEFELLMQLGMNKWLTFHSEHAILHRLPDYFNPANDPEHEAEMAGPARSRRGEDLPDLTWSAFMFLRKEHPQARLTPFARGLPFGWLDEDAGTFVTAGNNKAGAIVHLICEHGVTRLGVIADRPAAEPSDKEREKLARYEAAQQAADAPWGLHRTLWMNWMVLDPKGAHAMRHINRFPY